MPTREKTVADAIRLLEEAEYLSGFSISSAWLGIYQALLWYEPVNWVGFADLPHIIDADKLRPSSERKKRTWAGPRAWQRRAQALAEYLGTQLEICGLDGRLTRLMDLEDFVDATFSW